jgi:hypothetical protein
VRRRVDRQPRHLAQHLAGQRVEETERLDLVVEQFDPHGLALGFGREDVDHVAAHAVGALRQVEFVARVLHVGEAAQQLALVDAVAANQVQHHAQVRVGVTEAVDRRDRGDDDRVRPLEQRLGRREPHLLDVLVHRGVLLDERVGRRHVRLGLVVVVVADEVLDRVVREELLELAVELRRERLVVRHHERRALHALDHIGNAEGLARAGHAQQRLVREPALEPLDEALDRRRLITGGRVVGLQFECTRRVGHALTHLSWCDRPWGTSKISLKCLVFCVPRKPQSAR